MFELRPIEVVRRMGGTILVKSMTGYGRAREQRGGRDITVEVRSVNNRYLDCTVKMPRAYIFAEDAVKAAVQKAVSRGKVDVFISVDSLGAEETVVSVNEPLARLISALWHGSRSWVARRWRNVILPQTWPGFLMC